MKQTRRKLRRRKTMRGGDATTIAIVIGGILAVGIGALMYKTRNSMNNPNIDGTSDDNWKRGGPSYLFGRRPDQDDE